MTWLVLHPVTRANPREQSCVSNIVLWLVNVLKFAFRTSKDSISRYRAIWFVVSFAISSVLIIIGAGEAFVGSAAVVNPSSFEYVAILPGHIRTHGIILFSMALLNFWSVAALTQVYTKLAYTAGRLTGIGILFYTSFTAIGFGCGMLFGGQHYNNGVWWYSMTAVLSWAKVSLPPPFRGQPESDRPHLITGS